LRLLFRNLVAVGFYLLSSYLPAGLAVQLR
jgi:hypothetical protein